MFKAKAAMISDAIMTGKQMTLRIDSLERDDQQQLKGALDDIAKQVGKELVFFELPSGATLVEVAERL